MNSWGKLFAAVGSVLALAGCGGTAQAARVLPAAPALTRTAAPSPAEARPSARVRPAARAADETQRMEAEAVAFVRHYYDIDNRAGHDASLLPVMRSLYTSGCGMCVADYTAITWVVDHHRTVQDGDYRLHAVRADGVSGRTVSVVVGTTIDPSVMTFPDGHRSRVHGHPLSWARLTVTRGSRGWLVTGYQAFSR